MLGSLFLGGLFPRGFICRGLFPGGSGLFLGGSFLGGLFPSSLFLGGSGPLPLIGGRASRGTLFLSSLLPRGSRASTGFLGLLAGGLDPGLGAVCLGAGVFFLLVICQPEAREEES